MLCFQKFQPFNISNSENNIIVIIALIILFMTSNYLITLAQTKNQQLYNRICKYQRFINSFLKIHYF